MQKEVDAWISQYKDGYWTPHEIMCRLAEETGELAREINHTFGRKKKKSGESDSNLSEELGDILFTIICLANSQAISLDDSFDLAMEKCHGRDKERFEKK